MEELKWDKIDNKIKKLKYPLCFFNNLIKYNDYFTDYDFSFLIRLLFKNHIDLFYKFNVKSLANVLISKKSFSKSIIKNYYIFYQKKLNSFKIIYKWNESLNKKIKEKNLEDQLEYTKNLKKILHANYDISKSNVFIFDKVYPILIKEPDNHFIINNLIERLKNIFDLFGRKFFESYNLLIVTRDDYLNYNTKTKIKYSKYIFKKINKILNTIIFNYNNFIHYNLKLNNLINPKKYFIKFKRIDMKYTFTDPLFMVKD